MPDPAQDTTLLAATWRGWVVEPAVKAELERVYRMTAEAIEERGPACWASGRCCHFEKTGHRLYVTGLEAAYAVVFAASAGNSGRSEQATERQSDEWGKVKRQDRGEKSEENPPPGPLPLGGGVDADSLRVTLSQVAQARRTGGCPFQTANLCGIHVVKPLGCRVYFCDRSAQEWQHELTERMLGEIRAIHDRHDIEYRYGEWREMLEYFAEPKGTLA